MTIFGFNTDVRCGDTVYHVQTEARQADATLVSAIFLRGRCIGKYAISVGSGPDGSELSEQEIHDKLTAQHRTVVQIAREGNVESLLRSTSVTEPASPSLEATKAAEALPAAEGSTSPLLPALMLEWIRRELVCSGNQISMCFRISTGSEAVAGVQLIARLDVTGQPAVYRRETSDDAGEAQVTFAVDLPPNAEDAISVLVQASHQQQSVTRKFHLRRG